jgi:cytoskeletal protein CcmA (bactofilin family)
VKPVFWNRSNANDSGSHSVTLIGAGARVDGSVAFKGVLRVQGEILGDVACDGTAHGMMVVHKSGNVTGTIKSPKLVVSGRILGPVFSSESIEIHEGASVLGDAHYHRIDVRAGGVIDGLLTPTEPTDQDRSRQERPLPASQTPAIEESDAPPATRSGMVQRPGGGRRLGAALVLVVALLAVAFAWMRREPRDIAPAATPLVFDVAPPAKEVSPVPPVPPAPPARAVAGDAPQPVVGNVSPLRPDKKENGKDAVQAVAQSLPLIRPLAADEEKVVAVQGLNPDRPADVFFVHSKESSVLFKKKRGESAEGTPIDVHRGAKVRIAIDQGEIFRVAEGRNIDVFYQGRKVSPRIIASGAWMNFTPLLPGEAGSQ